MPDHNGYSGGPSPSKLDRFLNRLGRTKTPPRSNIRSRRGVSPPEPLAVDVGTGQAETPTRGAHDESAQMSIQRKRERTTELRRRREQSLLREQRRHTRFMEAAAGSPMPCPTAGPDAVGPVHRSAWMGPSAETDQFFDSPELHLLMQPVDTESMVSDAELPSRLVRKDPPLRRAKRPGKGPYQNLHEPPDCDEFDHSIDIPSTSLSPLVPRALDRRQRSRTAVFVPEGAMAADRAAPRPHTFVGATGGDGHGSEVRRQVEAELVRNAELRTELARLDRMIVALERVAGANRG